MADTRHDASDFAEIYYSSFLRRTTDDEIGDEEIFDKGTARGGSQCQHPDLVIGAALRPSSASLDEIIAR